METANKPQIYISRALPCQTDAIWKMEKECFSAPWSKLSIKSAVEDDTVKCITLFCDDEMAGYAMYVFAADEGELLNIGVSPLKRGLGFGKLMMAHVLDEAVKNGCETMFLEVRASNTPAASLYKSFGFEEIGIRKNYYRMPVEDAVVMALKINGHKI